MIGPYLVILLFVILGIVLVYAERRIYWITSLVLFLLLVLLVTPSSGDLANTIALKALAVLITLAVLLPTRFFSKLHQRRGLNVLKDYWKRK